MKKLLFSLLSILMLISLFSGCTPQQEKVGNYLEKAELTEEEINILKLAEAQEPLLFDFTVNTGKSFTIQTFELQNGQWVASQGYSSSINQDNLPIDGRIAIRQDEKTGALLLIAVQSKTGFTHSAPMPDESVPEYSAHSTTSLSSRTEIQINKPIAFHVYYGYSDNQTSHTAYFPDYALEHPEEIDSDYAQIVAITFSDKPLS